MRQNLRRRLPGAAPEEIERALVSWVRRRPGAPSTGTAPVVSSRSVDDVAAGPSQTRRSGSGCAGCRVGTHRWSRRVGALPAAVYRRCRSCGVGLRERIVRQLQERGWHVDALVEQDAAERLATVRLFGAPDAGPVVDLLFASSGVEPELVAAAEVLEVFPDQSIPVATLGHLIALKLLARDEQRSQDDSDLRALLDVADPGDRALARDTVRLIEQRGFARGRDLAIALDRLFEH